ncbi:MAG: LON peptidase substrate-binding domain-containing protein, partial [Cyclobacteriaceae bacterium]
MFKDLVMADLGETETEDLIQLINPEEEINEQQEDFPDELGILPIRNTVLFPGVVIPITVGRQKSIKLVKKAYKGDRIIGVVAQRNDQTEDPSKEDLYEVGTIAKIVKMLVLPDGNTTIIIQGKRRFKITEFLGEDPYFTAKIELLQGGFPSENQKEVKALVHSLKDSAS